MTTNQGKWDANAEPGTKMGHVEWEIFIGAAGILAVMIGGICKVGHVLNSFMAHAHEIELKNAAEHAAIHDKLDRIDGRPIPPIHIVGVLERIEKCLSDTGDMVIRHGEKIAVLESKIRN